MLFLTYIVLVLYTLVFFVAMCVVWVATAWWDIDHLIIHRFSRVWSMGYFRLVPGWRIRVEGTMPEGTFVIVSNHRSMLDIILMYALPAENFKWVSKKEVYSWPIFGWALWMHNDVAIERGSAAGVRVMMREGLRWLGRGVSMVLFPEGTRRSGEGLGQFRNGAFVLARAAGVRVLPVVLTGTDTAFVGKRLARRNDFVVHILQPMEPDAAAVKAAMSEQLVVRS